MNLLITMPNASEHDIAWFERISDFDCKNYLLESTTLPAPLLFRFPIPHPFGLLLSPNHASSSSYSDAVRGISKDHLLC